VEYRVPPRRQRVFRIHHDRQGIVLDHDPIDRVLRDVAALGHHRGDRLADVADPIGGDAVLRHRRVGEARERPGLLGGLGPGEHQEHGT